MNFKEDESNQLKAVKIIENQICEIFEIDVINRDESNNAEDLGVDDLFLDFEDIGLDDSLYTQEKRKGGESSYQHYKPLRDKVSKLCRAALSKKRYHSASQLCNDVAKTIEADSPELLSAFTPYQNHKVDGNDWKKPTFYGWCNAVYKEFEGT